MCSPYSFTNECRGIWGFQSMKRMMILGLVLMLPACALSDRGIDLNAGSGETVQMANAIDSSGLPMCQREDVEDWSDISD